MTVPITYSRAQIGIDAPPVTVEAHITGGLPRTVIVGLPEAAVRESKDRVRAAITNSGLSMPGRSITVNLAPADLPKQGGRYDLAIALALVAARPDQNELPVAELRNFEFMGELSLDGGIRPVRGILPAAIASGRSARTLVVPAENGAEAALAATGNVRVASSLVDVIGALGGRHQLLRPEPARAAPERQTLLISDIRAQQLAKRALVIAAAGAHNLLFIGPPGTGKTMLASRLGSLLPALDVAAAREVASVKSVSRQGFRSDEWGVRPFRSPHHTASAVALVGGGTPPKPGEISLAHHGVLFLDELPEFPRSVLEVLREPMESGSIRLSRANHQIRYPSRFQLVAAMNPCPCGYFGDDSGRCGCGIDQVERYRSRVSGPLLDRIDLHVAVPPLPPGALSDPAGADAHEHEDAVRLVSRAQAHMIARGGKLNAHLSGKETEQGCRLAPRDRRLLDAAMEKLGLSARGYFKVLRVARTIADLSGEEDIATAHLTEALGFRQLDRYRVGVP